MPPMPIIGPGKPAPGKPAPGPKPGPKPPGSPAAPSARARLAERDHEDLQRQVRILDAVFPALRAGIGDGEAVEGALEVLPGDPAGLVPELPPHPGRAGAAVQAPLLRERAQD